MNIFETTADYTTCPANLAVYVDYILQGTHFSGREEIEDHLACCPKCASEYAGLLGMALGNMIYPLLDLVLDVEAGAVDLDLLIEYNRHWFEICTLLEENAGAAAALSHIGLLQSLDSCLG